MTLDKKVTHLDPLTGILLSIKGGDRIAFDRLYRSTSPKLFGLALRMVKSQEIAEEILQETYIKVWRGADSYSPERGSVFVWISTILRYQAIDTIRKRHKILEDGVDDLDSVADLSSPLETLMQNREGNRLLACLDTLSSEHKTMVLEAYLNGATHASLAKSHQTPLGTVKTWIRRALQHLKQCMEDETE